MARLDHHAIHDLTTVQGLAGVGSTPPFRARRLLMLVGAVVVGLSLTGAAMSETLAQRMPLTVVVLGKGATVTSKPVGISCPGRCTASFAAGTYVALAPHLRSGFRLVRWAGSCKGSGACKLKVTSPAAVTAQIGTATKPAPKARPTSPKSKAGPKIAAEPGYYAGGSLLFFVSTTGTKVQNATTYNPVSITCVPAVSGVPTSDSGNRFAIAVAAIKPGGSFAGKVTQAGVFGGFAAKITDSVSGHLTPATAGSGAASGAGSFREDITFREGTTTHTCTSNNQPWTSAKNGPIPQPKSLVVPGKQYSGGSVIFSVSAAGAKVQNVTTYNPLSIACVPAVSGAPTSDQGSRFSIPEVAIKPDGSFAGRATQKGVFGNAPATITFSVAGNFQGLNGSYATAAGTYREDITFTDSAGVHACTSNTLPFSSSG
jgi:hypothetical protein